MQNRFPLVGRSKSNFFTIRSNESQEGLCGTTQGFRTTAQCDPLIFASVKRIPVDVSGMLKAGIDTAGSRADPIFPWLSTWARR